MDGDSGMGFNDADLAAASGGIRVDYQRLARLGGVWNADAAFDGPRTRTLHVLMGSGRACSLHGGMLPPMVLLPLRGHVRLSDGDSARTLQPDELFVSEAGQFLHAIGSSEALWVAFVAPTHVWQALFNLPSELTIPAPVLMPGTHRIDRATRRAALRLMQLSGRNTTDAARTMSAALHFGARLLDLQSGYDELVERCPGRTLAQRRRVLVRLQRACQYMESSNDTGIDISKLARKANYSPHHFVRTFNAVYGATPYARLVDRRLERAHRLVSDTNLSIAEVATASGFENRCAFSRAFKRRFGTSANTLRKHASREPQGPAGQPVPWRSRQTSESLARQEASAR